MLANQPPVNLGRAAASVVAAEPEQLGMLPSAQGGIARLALTRARAAGIDLAPLLKKAGLTLAQSEDDAARITVQSQIKCLNLVADALPDAFLGFHLAREFEMRQIGLLHYVLASSDVLGEALQRVARYSRLANEGISLRYSEGKHAVVGFEYVGVARRSDRHQIEFYMATVVRAARLLVGRNLVPRYVKLTHRREEDSSELDAYMGVKVELGAAVDEIGLPAGVKDMPIVSADPYLHKLLIAYCEEALAQRAPSAGSLRSTVENTMAPLLPHGRARVGDIAKRLGMSQRTLARRLAAEGLTFGQVLDQLRSDLARKYVGESGLSISQIAWLLGYQEASAFTHAFKRWTGRTPREARARENGARGLDQIAPTGAGDPLAGAPVVKT